MIALALIFCAYLVGSMPFGLWLGIWLKRVDIRTVGSGNIGATNAWRTLGWRIGIPVVVLDIGKGLVPVVFARHFLPDYQSLRSLVIVLTGLAAIIGHNNSVFLRFKGGKGISTSLGVAVGFSWIAGLMALGTWAVVLALTRYISVASLCAVPVGSVAIWLINGRSWPYAIFGTAATVFSFIKHRSNIERLRLGTEPKVGQKKKGVE